MPTLPLAGIRVIDMTMAWSGPYATMFLGRLRGRGHPGGESVDLPGRHQGHVRPAVAEMVAAAATMTVAGYPDLDPGDRPWNRNAMFNWHARNKRSMTLDLRKDVGQGTIPAPGRGIRRAGRKSPGPDARRPGLRVRAPGRAQPAPGGPADAGGRADRALPRLRRLRTRFRGAGGPEVHSRLSRNRAGGYAACPCTWTPLQARPAPLPSCSPCGVSAGPVEGSHIDLSQIENLVQHIGEIRHGERKRGVRLDRWAIGTCVTPLRACIPCAGEERWVVISVGCDEEWDGLRRAMGEPEWATDRRFDTVAGRMAAPGRARPGALRLDQDHGPVRGLPSMPG